MLITYAIHVDDESSCGFEAWLSSWEQHLEVVDGDVTSAGPARPGYKGAIQALALAGVAASSNKLGAVHLGAALLAASVLPTTEAMPGSTEGAPPRAFTVSGFSGAHLHGRFVQSGPLVNGMPAYVKDGSSDYWCCYDSKHDNWKIQPADAKGSGTGWAYTNEGSMPWDTSGEKWDEYVDGAWVKRVPNIINVESAEPAVKKEPKKKEKALDPRLARRKAAEVKSKKLVKLKRNGNAAGEDVVAVDHGIERGP